LVSAEDGIVVAEQLMEGIKGPAVSALAASLATRLRRAMEAAGVGASLFWHLQAEQGALLVVPTPGGTLVVAVAEPDVHVGLVRLELLRDAAGSWRSSSTTLVFRPSVWCSYSLSSLPPICRRRVPKTACRNRCWRRTSSVSSATV